MWLVFCVVWTLFVCGFGLLCLRLVGFVLVRMFCMLRLSAVFMCVLV